MQVKENSPLLSYNTFGISAHSKYLAPFDSTSGLENLLEQNLKKNIPLLILGGGSNVLFTKDWPGIVLLNRIKGIEIINEDKDWVYIRAGAGENWHHLVMYCTDKGYGGIENLSLIPGNVGAGPMQNIGAYGVELKDSFYSLSALEIATGNIKIFDGEACRFGYRESVFKNIYKGQYVIVDVTLKLSKNPVLNTSYGAIDQELEKMKVSAPTVKDVSNAVINIRRSKLPDPLEIGNAGSFFKNPVVSESLAKELRVQFPEMPVFPSGSGTTKIPAGWLIEKAGWKGFTKGNYGVHKLQALVLVNYGGATGKEIFQLSEDILQSIKEKFGITLEREVNVI